MSAAVALILIGVTALFGLGLIWWAIEEWAEIDDPHIYCADDTNVPGASDDRP